MLQRAYGESQKRYRKRLKDEQRITRGYLRGRRIWNSPMVGTYIRKEHGEIGSKAIKGSK